MCGVEKKLQKLEIFTLRKANEIEICKGCVSTDTYEWFKI